MDQCEHGRSGRRRFLLVDPNREDAHRSKEKLARPDTKFDSIGEAMRALTDEIKEWADDQEEPKDGNDSKSEEDEDEDEYHSEIYENEYDVHGDTEDPEESEVEDTAVNCDEDIGLPT